MIELVLRFYVPIALMVLMFGMGLQLVGMDWMRLVRFPRAVLVGLMGQFLLLPGIAFLLVIAFSLPVEIAAGIVILAACPGGIGSNSVSLLVRADIALSVSLTALSSVLALLTVPLIVGLGLGLVFQNSGALSPTSEIRLPLEATVRQLLLVMVLPLSAGMLVRKYAARWALKTEQWFRIGNLAVLLVLFMGAIAVGFEFLIHNFTLLILVTLALNLGSLLFGYLLARVFRLAMRQAITVAIESGIQNAGVGLLVALNLLNRPDWVVVPAVYSLVMMCTAFGLIALYRFGVLRVNP